MNGNQIYIEAYEAALTWGNTHRLAVAYAEWQLFQNMMQCAPPGSMHAAKQADYWAAEVIRLNVQLCP